MIYFVFYFIINVSPLLEYYFEFKKIEYLASICFFLLTLIKIFSEPQILNSIKQDLKYMINFVRCKKNIRIEDPIENESYYTFLNSAMNIEFVYLILIGINNLVSTRNNLSKLKIIKKSGKTQVSF